VLLRAGPAAAGDLPAPENDVPPPPPSGTDSEPSRLVPPPPPPPKLPFSRIGVDALVGGGVIGFLNGTARNLVGVGETWEARVAWATLYPLVVETAYIGTSQPIHNVPLASGAHLVGQGADFDLRFNPRVASFQPYILGGAGWLNYRIRSSALADTTQTTNNVLMGSVAAGVSKHWKFGLVVDLRGTFRFTFNDDLTFGAVPSAPRLNNWSATGRAGWSF
jgi:hypothetical protein